MQPTFFPWLGYFDLLDSANQFIFLDNVQLTKRSWQIRNRIKTQQGEHYISIPYIHDKKRDELLINEAYICDYSKWSNKTLKTIKQSYSKSPFYNEVYLFLENFFGHWFVMIDAVTLGQFNILLIGEIASRIGITDTKTHIISDYAGIEGTKDERLVNICKKFGCNNYLSPKGSSSYIEVNNPGGSFANSGITLMYQYYEHPTYPQLHGDFLPYMGIIDLLFNVGFENALEVIRSGHRDPYSVAV
jgi:hypothetical protein